MVDDLKKDKNSEHENIDENNEELDEKIDLSDFFDELSNLEKEIRSVAGDKIREKQKLEEQTSSKLDTSEADSILSGLEKGNHEGGKDKVSEFFNQSKEEFKKIDTFTEKKVVKEYEKMKDKFKNRPEGVRKAIEESADDVLKEIYDRKGESNLVARSLFRVVNWIMKTEK